ncbi:PadR family transcriptional regulator [Halorubrum sp. RMP-47]|uniref:PadR family transcriptional regulator n=1 Tax=Halorubrum miltondacostae TaxID=3076378 RepID=A0ABD5M5K7_9EURY
MIRELEQVCEEIDVDTEVTITPSEAGEMKNRTSSESPEPEPPHKYVETEIDDSAARCCDGWVGDGALRSISDDHVLAELDEILLLLIAVREEAIGKELSDDLNRMFGTAFSPGTVYPRLSELADEGILEVSNLPKRKVYSISDEEAICDETRSKIDRLLVFSATLRSLLVECGKSDRATDDTYE